MVFMLVAVLIVSLSGCRHEVLAEVNGVKITRAQLEERLLFLNFLMPEYGESMEDEEFKDYLEGSMLNSLIQNYLIKEEVERLELEVDEEEFESIYQEEVGAIAHQYFEGMEKYEERMKEENLPEHILSDMLRESYLAQVLYQHVVEGISEGEARRYYEENQDFFFEPARILVSHILVESEQEAQEVMQRLEEGEEFEAVLLDVSQDSPGEFFIAENDFRYDQTFKEAAFELSVGEISQPLETVFGWHIINLHERDEGVEYTFEEVKMEALDLKKREVFEEYFDNILSQAEIKNYLEEEH